MQVRGKEFSSIDVAAATRELRTEIVHSIVSNVYQLDAKTFVFKLHKTEKPNLWLVLEAGRRMNLTEYTPLRPTKPPAFCMALRKFLRNTQMIGIEQHEFEREVILSFSSHGNATRLVLELFGDGNLILISEKGTILHALIYRRMRDRNVLRGELFQHPPPSGRNPLKLQFEELRQGLKTLGDVEIVRALARFLSIGGMYSEEILARSDVKKDKLCNQLGREEINAIFVNILNLISRVAVGELEPCVVLDDSGSLIDALPTKLMRYQTGHFGIQPHATFNEALDEYYSKSSVIEETSQREEVSRLKDEAARLERVIADQRKTVVHAEAEADSEKRVGDSIYQHFSELQALFDSFLSEKSHGKVWKEIVAEVSEKKQRGEVPWTLFESFDHKESLIRIRTDNLVFNLDLRKTLFDNAAGFYDRGKRVKQKARGATEALQESLNSLKEVEQKIGQAESLSVSAPRQAMEELEKRRTKPKQWFEKFRWFISSDGFLVVAGKDATTNEMLIKKYTARDDYVFHADIVGAPFVVIKAEGKSPSETCLHEAGEFAAAHSRGWREGFASVDVYWVRPEQLSKGGPSGESVAHGAFMVRGERNWMRGVTLQIAVGIASEENGALRVIGGPLDAVKSKTIAHVIVVPGDVAGKELFKHMVKTLSGITSKELRPSVLNLSVETVREFVPFGRGTVAENRKATSK